ncbi:MULTISPECIES: DUF1064 domain-containing protein [Pseudomonas]|uniref:DUF1064 domain-containing protein n=1 Tax=Pseudomonas lutea TaxID=243924 RepID=A0A9X8QLR4_9PSED|nr:MULTISPECIES: DUF1064 domain-containing protein [Pseudomonas]SER37261.1 hypothetical protein SAMN05216409_11888 [Pseudomonas lutea]
MGTSLRMSEAELAAIKAKAVGKASAKPAKAVTGKERLRALGRLAPGEMNKTEQRYANHLARLQLAGAILWWKFEAITLRLAPRTHLKPDFLVMTAEGELQLHDVKGAKAIIEDDAHVKMKVAANEFPFRVFYAIPVKGTEAWTLEEV